MQRYDYLILGSGISGLSIALLAREHGTVLILTKGRIDDCNTLYAQGGIAAAIGEGDSPGLHLKDTLEAGAGLCDPGAVEALTHEGPHRLTDLIHQGVPFDTLHGEITLAREGAHSAPRVVHAGGDATGMHIELTLAQAVRDAGMRVLEYTYVGRILVEDGAAVGVEAVNSQTGEAETFLGRFVVLATGGAGRIYSNTTNPEVATGDGVALAFRAGAQVMDMEFYQFHPTALRLAGAPTFLISEAMRGEGATLRNLEGRPFMQEYHPLGDLAARDVVARAIVTEMDRTGADHLLLDATQLPAERTKGRFPSIYRFCLQHGLDITQSPIPVAPAAHYMMGGVKTNTWGETTLRGLYAAGEVACCGVHGANRLASNSLLDALVFGSRVVQRSAGSDAQDQERPETLIKVGAGELCPVAPEPSLEALQVLMGHDVGIVRNENRLRHAARVLYTWSTRMAPPTDRPSHELSNLVLLGRLMAEAALARKESRGAHFRGDYPEPSSQWLTHIVLSQSA